LIQWLESTDYFIAPSSTKFHGNYECGLVRHNYSLYQIFKHQLKIFKIEFPEDSQVICSLLHDVCKCNLYIKTGDSYIYNSSSPKGHAKLSLERIKAYIKLTEIEEQVIKYHMGFYGTTEFSNKGEYSLRDMVEIYNLNKLCKLFYFCDDMSAQFYEK
jgi:hypothetical protein